VVGLLTALFARSNGTKFFAMTQSSRTSVAKLWARTGEKGVQLLFVGIGIILAIAGCIALGLGTA